jgi:hypothetical protein
MVDEVVSVGGVSCGGGSVVEDEEVGGSTGGSVMGLSTLRESEIRGPSVVVGVGSGVGVGVSDVVGVSVVGSGMRGGKDRDNEINGGASVVVTITSSVEEVVVGGSVDLFVSDEVSVVDAGSVDVDVGSADTVITVGGPEHGENNR